MRSSWLFGLTALGLAVVSATFVGCAAGSDDPHGDGDDHDDQASNSVVEKVYTVDGWLSLEDEYVPRVCTQENGAAATEALKAQAVAARTYVLRAMRDDPTLGTTSNPIENGQGFQAFAAQANAGCIAASSATRGQVGEYEDKLIIANYVAGALWSNGRPSANDPTSTEHWVTYNQGLSGSQVHPTRLSLTTRTDNRGCMSQNGSSALADAGDDYQTILRYFFGSDLQITTLDEMQEPSSEPDGGMNTEPMSTDPDTGTNSDTDTDTGSTNPSSTWSDSTSSPWTSTTTPTTTTTDSSWF